MLLQCFKTKMKNVERSKKGEKYFDVQKIL